MPKRVLVVDDSSVIRDLTMEVLGQAGYEVIEAVDGLDGLHRWKSDATIAFVVCDINMPGMNGLQLLDEIKRDPRGAATPVLMLTTEGQRSMIERARQAGAIGWMVKPFKAASLVATVKKLLND